MPTASIKNTIGLGRTPREMKRLHSRIVLGITIVVVGSILIADGFLACRYLNRRALAENGGCSENCVPMASNNFIPRESSPATVSSATAPIPQPTTGLLGKSYEHGAVGLSFRYPSRWGSVSIKEVNEQTQAGETVIAGLALSFDNLGVFLEARNTGIDTINSTEESWGNDATKISSDQTIENWCDGRENCSIFMNSQGILVARVDNQSAQNYYLFNPNSGYSGVALSNQILIEQGAENPAGYLAQLVDSISFLGN